jgi:hypothetical protein
LGHFFVFFQQTCCLGSLGELCDAMRTRIRLSSPFLAKSLAVFAGLPVAAAPALCASNPFPRPVSDYATNAGMSLWQVLTQRVAEEPFNLVASLIFLCAIIHTFLAPKFRHWAHEVETAHAARIQERPAAVGGEEEGSSPEVSFKGKILHFFGEVEAVFGIWALALMLVLGAMKGWHTPIDYVGHRVNFTEPMFVVVIMALASTRPVLSFAEQCLRGVAALGWGSASAWWLIVLIIAPLFGSLSQAQLDADRGKFIRRRAGANLPFFGLPGCAIDIRIYVVVPPVDTGPPLGRI